MWGLSSIDLRFASWPAISLPQSCWMSPERRCEPAGYPGLELTSHTNGPCKGVITQRRRAVGAQPERWRACSLSCGQAREVPLMRRRADRAESRASAQLLATFLMLARREHQSRYCRAVALRIDCSSAQGQTAGIAPGQRLVSLRMPVAAWLDDCFRAILTYSRATQRGNPCPSRPN